MKYEGVTFVETAVREMDEEEFVERHVDAFWTDRNRKTRRERLVDVYARITKD
jgi:hypothetical protein